MSPNEHPIPDWIPISNEAGSDQRALYDDLRERCPVAFSEARGWTLFRHEDVVQALLDPETFSNRVSRYASVPNGMDPPEHTAYRAAIVPYFADDRMRAIEPMCREIVAGLVETALARKNIELMNDFALEAAVRIHTSFLGWRSEHQDFLRDWMNRSTAATHNQDRQAQSAIAREFERFIAERLEERRLAGAGPDQDVTASLMLETVEGHPLTDAEVASILRNWTAGEIGTMASAIGIVVHYLTQFPDLQEELRRDSAVLSAAIDEILRIHGPLVQNRRVTTRAVEFGGRSIGAGERISLNWVAANRDGAVFENPDDFSLTRNPDDNLLYGKGIHVCPGAPLARMELRVALEELLGRSTRIELDPDTAPTLASFPASGYAALPIVIA